MNKKLIYLIAGVAVAFAAIVLLLVFSGDKEAEDELIVHDIESTQESAATQHPALTLLERKEHDDVVELVTSYCTLSFPYAFSDLVVEEVVDEDGRIAIDFYAALGGSKYPIYTISFSGEGEIPLGSIEVDGETFEMTAKFFEDAADLQGDDVISFHAAQETFNDVWHSLEANGNFSSAQ